MKKRKIKPRPEIRAYARYWARRGRRVLGMKKSEYGECHIDYINSPGTVEVWFFTKTGILGRAEFTLDGRTKMIDDKRKKRAE